MISVVCMYIDEEHLRENLLKSLENQTVEFELIKIDTTAFESASKALNYGGRMAKGKFIMFVHQDVILFGNFWLEDVERTLNNIQHLGIAGCAGSKKGNLQVGFIKDRDRLWGKPLTKPELVQTLDECVLIVPKIVFDKLQFDEETFTAWHCYGADYCLSVREKLGLNAYVIPAFIHHNSPSLNVKDFLREQAKLFSKHQAYYKHIYTPCGELTETLRLKIWPIVSILKRSKIIGP